MWKAKQRRVIWHINCSTFATNETVISLGTTFHRAAFLVSDKPIQMVDLVLEPDLVD